MSLPLSEAVAALLHRQSALAATVFARRRLDAMFDAMLQPYRAALDQLWLRVTTRYMMTLELPNGTLCLGRDLPNPPGRPMFPPDLATLQDPELVRLLRIYRADGISTQGSGASEWSNLSERMCYILQLFRSRQQDACLFESPFDEVATETIVRGKVPLAGI